MAETDPTTSNTTPGHSTKFEYGNATTFAASTSWTEFAQILEIAPPEVEADDIEVSHMQSPDQFKQYDPGWADGGEIEMKIQFEKTGAAAAYALFRQKKGFRETYQDGSTWKIDGYIKKFGGTTEREGVVIVEITFKVSGKPVFTPAADAT